MRKLFKNIRRDFRFASRIFTRSPGLSAVVILSLAIGIGANTAVFGVTDALLLRPLPYPDSERLAAIWVRSPGQDIAEDWISPGEFFDIKNRNHVFQEMAIARGDSFNLTGRAQPERVEGLRASSALFRLLGAKALIGRLFGEAEDQPGGPASLVMTYNVWKRLYGADPRIPGQTLTLNGRDFAVLGVLTPDFSLTPETLHVPGGAEALEMFIPLAFGAAAINNRLEETYNVLARLRPGVSQAQAQADLTAIADDIRRKDHRDPTFTMSVLPLLEEVVGNVRSVLLVLIAAVCLVLLVACANVSNLLLSRAISRAREAAVRSAIGAGMASLIRPLLLESVLLSAAGGLAGLLLAFVLIRLLHSAAPGNLPRLEEIRINGAVLAFTGAVSLFTGMLFGIIPALRVANVDLNGYLKSGGRAAHSGIRAGRLRNALVISELALSLMLLAGAGLLIRSFDRLRQVPPGFNPDHLLSLRVSLRWPRYKEQSAITGFVNTAEERLARLPGITAAGMASSLPMAGTAGWGGLDIEGYTPPPNQPELQADMRTVSPGYFRAMQIPLREGRAFTRRDATGGAGVSIVDEKLARHFWPGQSALGKRIRFNGGTQPWMTVVGVSAVVRQYGLGEDARMAVYFPESQMTMAALYIVARTAPDPAQAARAIISEIHAIDPDLPVYSVSPMQDRVARSLARPRFAMTVFSAFAVFALILAAIGVYGVVSYTVTQSSRDIGVRMALGARPGAIARMVLTKALRLSLAGIAAGLCGAALLTRLMQSLLFGISPTDPVTFAAVSGFLVLVTLIASLLPALRAARLDPMTALREE